MFITLITNEIMTCNGDNSKCDNDNKADANEMTKHNKQTQIVFYEQ